MSDKTYDDLERDLKEVILTEPRIAAGVFYDESQSCGCPIQVLADRIYKGEATYDPLPISHVAAEYNVDPDILFMDMRSFVSQFDDTVTAVLDLTLDPDGMLYNVTPEQRQAIVDKINWADIANLAEELKDKEE